MKKIYKKRNKSRKLLLLSLYSQEIAKNNIQEIENYILKKHNIKKLDIIYFRYMLKNIELKKNKLENIIENNIEKNTYMSIIDKIIIKIATYEIFFCKKIPENVIINESLNLSKKFSTKNAYMIVNKILNNIKNDYIKNNK